VSFQVEIITRDNIDVVHGLSQDQTDIGVMYKLNPVSELDYCAEFETPFAVIAAPHHPLAQKKEIAVRNSPAMQWRRSERSNATRRILEKALTSAGVEIDYTLQVNSIEMAKEFASTGMGVTVLPAMAAQVECANGSLVAIPLSDWSLRRVRVGLCTHRGHELSKTAQTFLDLLKQRCVTH